MNTQNKNAKWVRWVMVVMTAVLLGVMLPASEAFAAKPDCSCVDYVVDRLFGGPISGNWGTAASMATDSYWNHPEVVNKGQRRHNLGWGKAGDVVIMPPGTQLYFSYSVGSKDIQNFVPYTIEGDGHIGFVESATYLDPKKDAKTGKGGWLITIRHAHWNGPNQHAENGCNTVSVEQMYIPNGTATSWWRKY